MNTPLARFACLAAVLAVASLPALTGILRIAKPGVVASGRDPAPVAVLSLVLLLALGFGMPARVADAFLASADLLAAAPAPGGR